MGCDGGAFSPLLLSSHLCCSKKRSPLSFFLLQRESYEKWTRGRVTVAVSLISFSGGWCPPAPLPLHPSHQLHWLLSVRSSCGRPPTALVVLLAVSRRNSRISFQRHWILHLGIRPGFADLPQTLTPNPKRQRDNTRVRLFPKWL